MKKEVITLLLMLIIVITTSILVEAQCYDEFLNPIPCELGEGREGLTGAPKPGPEEIIIEIDQTLADNKVVDFSKDPYKSNPEATLEALKEKYPDLDLNSIDGVKIDGDTLTTKDGSKINLKTGKKITVETDGSKWGPCTTQAVL